MSCNMACKYCYLEDNTKDEFQKFKPLETLEYAIKKFHDSNVIPFNISLHGGEVTTLSHDDLYFLTKYVNDYYNENKEIITKAGFKIGKPHIKTNLSCSLNMPLPYSPVTPLFTSFVNMFSLRAKTGVATARRSRMIKNGDRNWSVIYCFARRAATASPRRWQPSTIFS